MRALEEKPAPPPPSLEVAARRLATAESELTKARRRVNELQAAVDAAAKAQAAAKEKRDKAKDLLLAAAREAG